MIIESITEGFNLANKNWQIIIFKIATSIINIIGFFIFVGIPVALAFVSLGIDLNEVENILPGILRNPGDFFSKYLGLVFTIFIAVSIYLTVASVLLLYVYSGTLGMLRNSAVNFRYKFNIASFLKEAKNFFFPLLWLFSIALFVIIVVLAVFGISALIFSPVLQKYLQSGATIFVFIASFLSLLILFLIVILLSGSVIITAYSAVSLIVKNLKLFESIKNAWHFANKNPGAYLLYIILIFIIIAVNLLLKGIGTIFLTASTAGLLISIPYLLIAAAVQSYFSVAMWGALLVFYIKKVKYPVYTVADTTYDI